LEEFSPTDADWPSTMRINPILDWNYGDVWNYLLLYKVPYCSLYDQGYTSLGNNSNTSKNPSLKTADGSYLPAYLLKDYSEERKGRIE
jgi:FAD synthetase